MPLALSESSMVRCLHFMHDAICSGNVYVVSICDYRESDWVVLTTQVRDWPLATYGAMLLQSACCALCNAMVQCALRELCKSTAEGAFGVFPQMLVQVLFPHSQVLRRMFAICAVCNVMVACARGAPCRAMEAFVYTARCTWMVPRVRLLHYATLCGHLF